jgi:ketosteroid isomerase-like protein
VSVDRERIVAEFYEAFNHHDMEVMEEHLAPEVDWSTADGARQRGRGTFRSYWLGAWQTADIRIEPMQMVTTDDGEVHVRVQQVVTASDGKILENKKLEQVFGFVGVFINRIDVIDRDPAPDDEDEDEDGDGDA